MSISLDNSDSEQNKFSQVQQTDETKQQEIKTSVSNISNTYKDKKDTKKDPEVTITSKLFVDVQNDSYMELLVKHGFPQIAALLIENTANFVSYYFQYRFFSDNFLKYIIIYESGVSFFKRKIMEPYTIFFLRSHIALLKEEQYAQINVNFERFYRTIGLLSLLLALIAFGVSFSLPKYPAYQTWLHVTAMLSPILYVFTEMPIQILYGINKRYLGFAYQISRTIQKLSLELFIYSFFKVGEIGQNWPTTFALVLSLFMISMGTVFYFLYLCRITQKDDYDFKFTKQLFFESDIKEFFHYLQKFIVSLPLGITNGIFEVSLILSGSNVIKFYANPNERLYQQFAYIIMQQVCESSAKGLENIVQITQFYSFTDNNSKRASIKAFSIITHVVFCSIIYVIFKQSNIINQIIPLNFSIQSGLYEYCLCGAIFQIVIKIADIHFIDDESLLFGLLPLVLKIFQMIWSLKYLQSLQTPYFIQLLFYVQLNQGIVALAFTLFYVGIDFKKNSSQKQTKRKKQNPKELDRQLGL